MAVIFQQDFTKELGRKGLRLQNEEWLRTLAIGTNWNRLRIGINCAIYSDGNNFTGGVLANLFVGMCVGQTYPFGSPNCINATGQIVRYDATFTYNAGSGNPYYSTSCYGCNKIGASITYSAGAGTCFIATTNVTNRRTPYFYDLPRGSAWEWAVSSAANVYFDWTTRDFLNAVDQINAATIWYNATQYDVAAVRQDAMSNQSALLDTVDIYWGKASYPLEIYGICVVRCS